MAILILDENVFIQSHTCKNISDDQDNYYSLKLVLEIIDGHQIGLSPLLADLYYEKAKYLELNKKLNPRVQKIWIDLLNTSNKHRYCDIHLNDLPNNVLHDRHVIEPACILFGVLVTMDERLKENMRPWFQTHRFVSILSPRETLTYLRKL